MHQLDKLRDAYRRIRPKNKVYETVESLVVAVGLALLIRATIFEARYIPSESMLPTLLIDDHLLVEKLSYHFRSPARGDIIVFTPPEASGIDPHEALIKRVIGLPGETVEVKYGRVYINDKPLYENYLKEAPNYPMDKLVIPANSYFMMGDNRNNSDDSHIWGTLPGKNIIGHAFLTYWPPMRMGLIH